MARTIEDVNSYLNKLEMPYEEIKEGTWVIHDHDDKIENIVVSFAGPIVVFRVKVMNAPANKEQRAELCETLLRLNATDMVAGAYGLEGNSVVWTDTLQSENLDYNEFQASVDALSLSISQHYRELSKYNQN